MLVESISQEALKLLGPTSEKDRSLGTTSSGESGKVKSQKVILIKHRQTRRCRVESLKTLA